MCSHPTRSLTKSIQGKNRSKLDKKEKILYTVPSKYANFHDLGSGLNKR